LNVTNVLDKRNEVKIRFPIFKIPEKFYIKKRNGEKKEYRVKYVAIRVRTMAGEYRYPDGSSMGYMEHDPSAHNRFCIPTDGNRGACEKAPLFAPVIPDAKDLMNISLENKK
jgi:hypothetical protein